MLAMARGFTNEEKETIKTALLVEGKKLFGNFGLKKTNIAQLTSAAGISPATFYQFFQSKEDLYFAIFQAESEKAQADLLNEVSLNEDGVTAIKKILFMGKAKIQSDPFFKQLLIGEDLEQVIKTRSKNEIDTHLSKDYEQFLPFVESLLQEGKVKQIDPNVFTAIIQMYFLLHEHQEKFGEDIFDKSMNLLANWIALGMANSKKE
jgi:AcrR family transcriptional regulator